MIIAQSRRCFTKKTCVSWRKFTIPILSVSGKSQSGESQAYQLTS